MDNRGIRRHYRVLAVLGEGGFGKVYLVRDLMAGGIERYAALKVLRSDARVRDEQRFRDEATILSLLDHPSFVRVNALFRLDGRWAFDMEYVRGATLDRVLGMRGSLPPAAALEVAQQVGEALNMAWNHAGPNGKPLHVMHRDIKPSNLLLTRAGVVKVLDFGIARWEAAPREAETATRLPASVGYMAPERFGFSADFGPEADIYALGAVLWEMLVGEPYLLPGAVDTTRKVNPEVLGRYARDRGERLAGLNLPGPVVELVNDMLAIDPAARPSSAELSERCEQAASVVGRGGEARAWVRTDLGPMLDRLPTGTDGDGWCGRELASDPLQSHADDRGAGARFLPLVARDVGPERTLVPTPRTGTWPPSTSTSLARRLQWGGGAGLALLALCGALWFGLHDTDGDGAPDRVDCAPADPGRREGADEICDGIDQDCDGVADEGLPSFTLYVDQDGDGFGAGVGSAGCLASRPGFAATLTDCDDTRAAVRPGAAEIPGDGVDQDCDPSTADVLPAAAAAPVAATPAAPATGRKPAASAAVSSTASAPAAAPTTGRVSVVGSAATVSLAGERNVTLRKDQAEDLPAGRYTVTLKGELGSTTQDLRVPAGGTVVFDCTRPTMGLLCKVSVTQGGGQ